MPAQTPADVQGDGLKSTLSPSLHAMVNDLRAHRPDLKDKPDEAVLSLALEAMGAKVGARSSQQPDSAGQEHNDAATGVAGAIDRVSSPAAASSSNGAGAAAGTTGVDGSGGASGSGDGGDSAAGMWTIVFIAIASSSATNIGKALQKKATTEVSTLSLRSLASNGLWRIGMATDIGGALLTLHLLSIAPVSVVQPLGGSGSAALALFAHHYLGERLSTTEWTGVAVLILGTTGIGLSDPGAGGHGEEVISTVSALHTLMLLGPAAVITEIVHRRSTAPTAKSKQPGSPALTPNGPLNELAAGFGSGVCFGLSGTLSRIGMVLGKRATATAAASVAVVSAGAASGGAAGGVAGGPGAGLVVVGEEAAAAYSYMYVVAGITASIMVTSLGIFFQVSQSLFFFAAYFLPAFFCYVPNAVFRVCIRHSSFLFWWYVTLRYCLLIAFRREG